MNEKERERNHILLMGKKMSQSLKNQRVNPEPTDRMIFCPMVSRIQLSESELDNFFAGHPA